jgi:hypothetical protein
MHAIETLWAYFVAIIKPIQKTKNKNNQIATLHKNTTMS